MTLTTVTGRVRGTQRLKASGADGAHVVATSWASDRSFPRTTGAAVPFELEGGDGTIYRVDPFEALVALPVRKMAVHAGVRHEAAWIAIADQIIVEGELERTGRGRAPPNLRARRIAAMTNDGGTALHRLPPRALQRGESEKIDAPLTPPPPPVTMVTTVSVGGEPQTSSAAEPSNAGPNEAADAASADDTTVAVRRPRKKRPDSSGTPTPVQ